MPRRKNINTNNNEHEFIYCGWRKCPNTQCLRHNVNTPYGVLILQSKDFKPDREWNCKDMVI